METEKEKTQKIKTRHEPCLGLLWGAGWLFTIGFLRLTFGKGVLAIVIWPYYLGAHFSH